MHELSSASNASGDLLSARAEGVLTLTLNRPSKKNALTGAMYSALAQALTAADSDDTLAAIVILGQPGAFCAGNDLQDFLTHAHAGLSDAPVLHFLRALARCTKPLLAGVDGVAIGVGTTMLLHCDYVIASERSVFATPFVELGLVPEAASSLLAPRVMGHARAFELLVMGERFSAKRALEAGILNHLVSETAISDTVHRVAAKLASQPREALLQSRALLRGSAEDILVRMEQEATLFSQRLASKEARAAFAAFLGR